MFPVAGSKRVSYNGHEAELDYVPAPQRIKDSDEHKKSISYSVKIELFLITAMRQIW